MRKTLISIAITVALFIGLFYILNANKAKNEAQAETVSESNNTVSVRVVTAEFKDMNFEYTANGTFAPIQEVFISTELPGKVVSVIVKEGTKVSAGQTLAIIKGDQQGVAVANAEAVYNNAQNEVRRFESAYKTGGVTQQQLEQVKLQLENAKNNLQSARLNAGSLNVTASFPGIVNKKFIEAGSYVNPGQQLFEIVNISKLKLNVNIDEKTIGSIHLGQKVTVKNSVLTEFDWEGIVTFISPKADASLNFPIELEINNNGSNELKAGMYGTAFFGKDQISKALVIPKVAFLGNVSSRKVFVNENNHAQLRTVNIGRDFGDYVEILSGIKEGEQVITSGQINLSDNTEIELIK